MHTKNGKPNKIVEEIYRYYLSDSFKPILPRLAKFRHFRFKLPDGSWRKVHEKIEDSADLVKWVIKLGGTDVYYGTTLWLNPHKVSTKEVSQSYFSCNTIALGNELTFDIDAKEPVTIEGLQQALDTAKKVHAYVMQNTKERYEFLYFSFTGHKGFRLSYIDTGLRLPMMPTWRMEFIEHERYELVKKMREHYNDTLYGLDSKVTINPMSVVRVLGSVHSTTGHVSVALDKAVLSNPSYKVRDILKSIPNMLSVKPVIPLSGKMIEEVGDLPRPRAGTLAADESGFSSLPQYYTTNRVLGVKRNYIPVFEYLPKHAHYMKDALALQKKYKLGTLYIYKTEDRIYVISLKAMQKRQLKKILIKSTSINKHTFDKIGKILVPFKMPKPQTVVGSFTGHLSRGHYLFVKPYAKHANKDYYCGWDKIEMLRYELES